MRPTFRFSLATLFFCSFAIQYSFGIDWQVGVAKGDITPEQPIRLSGYAGRSVPFDGIADSLSARVMIFSTATNNSQSPRKRLVLVSLDSIVATSDFTVNLANWLKAEYQIPRSQLVVCSTHSHAAPHLAGGLKNLFRTPLSGAENENIATYTNSVAEKVRELIVSAVKAEQPAKLSIGTGKATFAANRRMIREGKWQGFGVEDGGSVDHRVRFLRAETPSGTVLGGAFQYACHCTTLGGGFTQVSGDWAGLAATQLEKIHPEAVFLPVIGCGADSNPNPRGSYELSQQYAAQIVDAVERLMNSGDLADLEAPSATTFGYAAIAPEQPSSTLIESRLQSENPNEQRWAEYMVETKKEMGRLPESYPMPVHCWKFGNQLSWVFLGGEVVVDYQYLIEKELPTEETWVAAYADDVFAYVASESMRVEGGYEVDSSMIYYLQPGRWQSGTQRLILKRVREIFDGEVVESEALSPAEGLAAIRVPDDYQVELLAAEPLVQDPINISFGVDGRIWVVEMADYPLGGKGGGRVRWLRDADGNGTLDESTLFLDGLDFPTSVHAWKDGAIIISAPDVLWARDLDSDGRADQVQKLLSGIHPANPQHRASGFEIGLDGWLHFGAGDGTDELVSHVNNKSYKVHGHDVAWNPETGEIRLTSGETQFVRSRDAFGNWFGNSNSRPMYQYVIESRYLKDGGISGGARADLLEPAVAPPVMPRSQVLSRFNDLFALNRFTSACSSIVSRVPGIQANTGGQLGFICEPVHNLVARVAIERNGSTFRAVRHNADQAFDFFTSTDPWSRPVRVVNAPDGSIWILDMVRKVIEHPEWIPTAWQERINLRAGEGMGRIYRVYSNGFVPNDRWPDVLNSPEQAIQSDNGAIRDLALQQLLSSENQAAADLRSSLSKAVPEVRAAIYPYLNSSGSLQTADLVGCLRDPDQRVVRVGLRLVELQEGLSPAIKDELERIAKSKSDPATDLQWLLSVQAVGMSASAEALSALIARSLNDEWCLKALSTLRDPQECLLAVEQLLSSATASKSGAKTMGAAALERQARSTFSQLWKRCDPIRRRSLAVALFSQRNADDQIASSDLMLLQVLQAAGDIEFLQTAKLENLTQAALSRLTNENAPLEKRIELATVLASPLVSAERRIEISQGILGANEDSRLQQAVVNALYQNDSPEIAKLIVTSWDGLSGSIRSAASSLLLSRRSFVAELVAALENKKIKPSDLDPATVQQLRSYWDRDLRTRCTTVLGAPSARNDLVETYLKKMPRPEASSQGEKLYVDNCAACHQSKGGIPAFAPPLENLKHWTVGQWVTAVLDPNQNVEPKYWQSRILTVDGQAYAGLVLEQNNANLRIGMTDGSVKVLDVEEIEQIQESRQSLMPEGLEQKLDPQALAHLIGYLRSK